MMIHGVEGKTSLHGAPSFIFGARQRGSQFLIAIASSCILAHCVIMNQQRTTGLDWKQSAVFCCSGVLGTDSARQRNGYTG